MLLLLGVIFMIRTPEGTIVVQVDQPDAEISVDEGKITLKASAEDEPVEVEVAEGRHALKGAKESTIDVADTQTGQTSWIAVQLGGARSVTFSPAGEILHGAPEVVERELVHFVESPDGVLQLLKPSEFQKRVAAGAGK